MSLIQHSSASECWGTPLEVIEAARRTMGSIDLDPASDWQFNQNVKAKYHITKEENGLRKVWPTECNVFLNPPGSKNGKYSNTVQFWQRLMGERTNPFFKQAVFVAFSLELLQTSQQPGLYPIASFPMCFPKSRLRFIDQNGKIGSSPSHGNVISYVPGTVDRTLEFRQEFKHIGYTIIPT